MVLLVEESKKVFLTDKCYLNFRSLQNSSDRLQAEFILQQSIQRYEELYAYGSWWNSRNEHQFTLRGPNTRLARPQ